MEKLQDLESVAAKNENTDDEISLLDLVAVLLHYKKMIIIVTAAAMLFAVIYSVISLKLPPEKSPLPNKYTPVAHMLIKEESSGAGLPSSLSSLASLAGVSVGGSGSSRSSLTSNQ